MHWPSLPPKRLQAKLAILCIAMFHLDAVQEVAPTLYDKHEAPTSHNILIYSSMAPGTYMYMSSSGGHSRMGSKLLPVQLMDWRERNSLSKHFRTFGQSERVRYY